MSPPRLELDFLVEDGLPADGWPTDRLRALVHAIVAGELPEGDYSLGLHLVGDATIRALNAEHRGRDAPTDVLSFPLHATPDARGAAFVLPPGQPVSLGDVVVSYPRAVEQAAEFGHSTDRELGYLVAHGVLHALGYDHEQEDERRLMRQREEEALAPHGFVR